MIEGPLTDNPTVAGALVRLLRGDASEDEQTMLASLAGEASDRLLPLLGRNVVGVRALTALGEQGHELGEEAGAWLAAERRRVEAGLEVIATLTALLDDEGIPFAVIKTGDHFPDQGHDVDILVGGGVGDLQPLLRRRFELRRESRSLSEVLAAKANLRLGTITLEIHRGRLGQVGEHRRLAEAILARRRRDTIGGVETWVPSTESRLILALLQRIYRHFNFRLCDIVNVGALIESPALERDLFWTLCRQNGVLRGARLGVAMVADLSAELGRPLQLAAEDPVPRPSPARLWFGRGFYRFSLGQVVPAAYGGQLAGSLRRGAAAQALRLLLLGPMMAVVGANIRFFPRLELWRKLW